LTGWIKLHRDIRHHWIWQNENYYRAWSDLLMEANHENKTRIYNESLVTIKRGEIVSSLNMLSNRWKMTIHKTRHFLKLLEKDSMIVRKTAQGFTHLTICNYDTYQDSTQTERKSNANLTQTERKSNATPKELKNVKNEKKHTRSDQLELIKSNLSDYSKKYPTLNIQFYYDSFVDWLDATGKQYKKYESAFNNCCRSEWYKDRPGSSKSDQIKSNDILIACPDGHYSRKVSKGVRGVCPKCHEQLLPNEEIQLKRAMA